jgi:HSP20 family protein
VSPVTPPDDPWDAWRKRGLNPRDLPAFFADFEKEFPDFFRDFEREFARMQGMMERVMEDAVKHANSPRRGEPFVYGFSMRVGADGVPHLTPFGSAVNQTPLTPEEGGAPALPDAREPLTDVQETEREITVTVELPGAEKQDVQLHVAEDLVTVKVEKGRRYAARVKLPAKVEPASAKATFKNSILDLVLRKQPEAAAGQRVHIE